MSQPRYFTDPTGTYRTHCNFCGIHITLGCFSFDSRADKHVTICVPCIDTVAFLMGLECPPLQPLVEKHI